MIATTGDARVYCAPKILYVYYETRLTTNTHIRMETLSCSVQRQQHRSPYLSLSKFLSLRDVLCSAHRNIEHRVVSRREKKNCMMVKKYPPSHGSSLRLLACCSSLMRSSVQTHSYVVVVITQYILCSDSLFCMIAIFLLCCYYLGSFSSCKNHWHRQNRGRGRASNEHNRDFFSKAKKPFDNGNLKNNF